MPDDRRAHTMFFCRLAVRQAYPADWYGILRYLPRCAYIIVVFPGQFRPFPCFRTEAMVRFCGILESDA